jgi:hypothetical protein
MRRSSERFGAEFFLVSAIQKTRLRWSRARRVLEERIAASSR